MSKEKQAPEYVVVTQGKLFAVRRIGPRGGVRHIAVYRKQNTADMIAATLNLAELDEVTG